MWIRQISFPDLVTLANGLAGFLSIMYVIDRNFTMGMVLILMAVLLDGADGALANVLGHTHSFGRKLDSISDTVSFCFAPATLLYVKYYDLEKGSSFVSLDNALTVTACMLIVGFGILRLARFIETDNNAGDFTGLPTPAAAILIIMYVVVIESQSIVLMIAIAVSFLMISPIDYPKLLAPLNSLAGALIVLAMISIWYSSYTPLYMFSIFTWVMINIYVVGGPFYARRRIDHGYRE